MFGYNLTSLPSFDINRKVIDNIFISISKIIPKEQKGILNIVFLDTNDIKKLNNDYRNINKTTDVLSFHYFEDFSNLQNDDIAGEIILSEEKILLQAREFGLGNEKEFYKLIIHSILHIIGFDHELNNDYEKMQNLENKIWQEVFEK